MMKKMLFACCVLIQILVFSACKEKENGGYQVSSVSIRLVYPEGSGFEPVEGVSVTLKNTSGSHPDKYSLSINYLGFFVSVLCSVFFEKVPFRQNSPLFPYVFQHVRFLSLTKHNPKFT